MAVPPPPVVPVLPPPLAPPMALEENSERGIHSDVIVAPPPRPRYPHPCKNGRMCAWRRCRGGCWFTHEETDAEHLATQQQAQETTPARPAEGLATVAQPVDGPPDQEMLQLIEHFDEHFDKNNKAMESLRCGLATLENTLQDSQHCR